MLPNSNIPGLFAVIQGARAQAARPAPVPATGGYDGGGQVNIPGYQTPDANGGSGTIPTAPWQATVTPPPGAPGADGTDPNGGPLDPNSAYYYDIAKTYGLIDANGEMDLGAARDIFNADPSLWVKKTGAGGDSNATSMAIAQMSDARKAQEDADSRAEHQQTAQANQQVAMQDFLNSRDNLVTQRKKLANDAASSALQSWASVLGQANIPGMANMRPISDPAGTAQIMSGAPVLGFNPMLAMGQQLNQPSNNPQPNIPGVAY